MLSLRLLYQTNQILVGVASQSGYRFQHAVGARKQVLKRILRQIASQQINDPLIE